jgi:hypothetical protein
MTRLRDTLTFNCSVERTKRGLENFLNSLRAQDGVSRLRLRVPVNGAKTGFALDREVRIEARRAQTGEIFEITWVPEGSLVFPRFEGTLAVCGDETLEGCSIELDGTYTPPYGKTGQVFDAAIGHQIAESTAREFLKDLKSAIERQAAP